MRRLLITVAVLAAIAAGCLATTSSASAAASGEHSVVLILAPYLDWADISATSTPAIWSLAEDGAVGAVNARSRARQSGERGSPLEGALSISAGSWAVAHSLAPAAYSVNERYEVGTAAEAFQRTTGEMVGEQRVVFLGMPMTQRLNDERSYETSLGTLGQAVVEAGGLTAAIGNSDVGYVTGEQRKVRPAALAAMDDAGLVMYGDISMRLIREDPNAPFGIETDPEAFAAALDEVADKVDAESGPSLVVLDAGDSYRAMKFRGQVTDAIYEQHRARGLATLDRVVAMAEGRFPDATIMVVSQSTGDPEQGDAEGLGPIIIGGGSGRLSGFVTSNSTQRTGLVTNLDVTATVLDSLGLERPVQVLGNAMREVPAPASLESRMDTVARLNQTAVAVDSAKPGVVNTFVALTVLALVLTAFALFRAHAWSDRLWRAWSTSLKVALLYALAVPVSSWLMFLVVPRPETSTSAIVALLGTATVLWLISLAIWRYTRSSVPVAVLCLVTVAVLAVDQFLGGPASFTNFFGYSPLLAARFYGMGNEAAAIMFGAAIVGAALLFDEFEGGRLAKWGKRIGLPVLAVLMIGTAAAPFWGANVGVVAWGMVGFGLAYVLMNGHKLTWKLVLGVFAAVVAVVGIFAAIDILGGGAQTHLARAIQSALAGGPGELVTIVVRKAETNLRVLTRTNWAYILIATLAFLGVMRWRPTGDFAEVLADNPAFADAITVSLIAGVAAYFTEDSGIVIPALEFFYVGVAIAWLLLARQSTLRVSEESAS